MPVYEFSCDVCGKQFEHLVRSPDDGVVVACPDCDAQRVSKRPSVFSAHDAPRRTPSLPTGGCGRCGDPNGPCGSE